MSTANQRVSGDLEIFKIYLAGPEFPMTVIARSLRRALELALDDDTELPPQTPMLVQDVRRGLLNSNPRMAQHTWSVIGNGREGRIIYDRDRGWSYGHCE